MSLAEIDSRLFQRTMDIITMTVIFIRSTGLNRLFWLAVGINMVKDRCKTPTMGIRIHTLRLF